MIAPGYGLAEVGTAAVKVLASEVVGLTAADAVVARTAARLRYRTQVQGQSYSAAEDAERRDPITALATMEVSGARYVELRDLVAELWPQIETAAGRSGGDAE